MSRDATVLIVDDEKELASGYADTLSSEHDVLIAHSGEKALERLDQSVDVVLLDRRMPDIAGEEVLKRMDKERLQCRVVMVTAVDPDLDIIELDFDEYLVKPVTNDELLDVVERMLARNAHDAQIEEMVTVATKLATLETKLEFGQIESSNEYETLRGRFDELREEVNLSEIADDMYIAATREKIHALLNESQ